MFTRRIANAEDSGLCMLDDMIQVLLTFITKTYFIQMVLAVVVALPSCLLKSPIFTSIEFERQNIYALEIQQQLNQRNYTYVLAPE